MSFSTAKPVCPILEKRAGCMQSALAVLGDKWTPLLLGQLVANKKSFGDLEIALSGISPRTLSLRLEKLVTENIVTKELYCKHPPRYMYVLTDKGLELQDVLERMVKWGDKHHYIR